MAKFQIGSYEHKKLFCALMQDSADLPGLPNLSSEEKERFNSAKVFAFAVDQLDTSAQVAKTLANTSTGSLMKDAIAQLVKSNRQAAKLLKPMASGRSTFPKNRFKGGAADFKTLFHQLNLSLFLAGGLLELAQRANFLSPDVSNRLERLLDQQATHAVFFVNWLAFQSQVNQKPEYEWSGLLAIAQNWSGINAMRSMFNRSDYDDNLPNNPTQLDYFMGQWTFGQFLEACETRYEPRFEQFDERLIRPTKLLKTSHAVRTILGFWPQRTVQSRASSSV